MDFTETNDYLLSKQGKIIHQIWFGTFPTKKEAEKMFKKLALYRHSWINKNPDWTHIIWNKSMCKKLLQLYYPEHLELFHSYKYDIQRCDMIRYFILYHYGGIYADMDYYCNNSFTKVLQKYNKSLYFVETKNSLLIHSISNSLMYSVPNHPFWRKLFIELEKAYENIPWYYSRHIQIMYSTGPSFLNRLYTRYQEPFDLHSFPARWFHPIGLDEHLL